MFRRNLCAHAYFTPIKENEFENVLCVRNVDHFFSASMYRLSPRLPLPRWRLHRKRKSQSTVKSLIQVAPNPQNLMFFISSCNCLCPINWSHVLSKGWRWQAMLQLHLNVQQFYWLLRYYIRGLTVCFCTKTDRFKMLLCVVQLNHSPW